MAKKNQNTKNRTTKKCQCSICGQIANATVGTAHFYCKGLPLDMLARMPGKLRNMTNPLRAEKAKWEEWIPPVKESPIAEQITSEGKAA
jgi:hypothetical protein